MNEYKQELKQAHVLAVKVRKVQMQAQLEAEAAQYEMELRAKGLASVAPDVLSGN